DPELQKYPVFHVSEGGAETDNVGLQFLAIPKGATTLLPAGTEFADYANVHNYVSANGVLEDNQAWQAADPTLNSRWDGLFGEYGV
ncbi:glycosyl hydrolase, partial [Pseudomonas sp. FW215-L1]